MVAMAGGLPNLEMTICLHAIGAEDTRASARGEAGVIRDGVGGRHVARMIALREVSVWVWVLILLRCAAGARPSQKTRGTGHPFRIGTVSNGAPLLGAENQRRVFESERPLPGGSTALASLRGSTGSCAILLLQSLAL